MFLHVIEYPPVFANTFKIVLLKHILPMFINKLNVFHLIPDVVTEAENGKPIQRILNRAITND